MILIIIANDHTCTVDGMLKPTYTYGVINTTINRLGRKQVRKNIVEQMAETIASFQKEWWKDLQKLMDEEKGRRTRCSLTAFLGSLVGRHDDLKGPCSLALSRSTRTSRQGVPATLVSTARHIFAKTLLF